MKINYSIIIPHKNIPTLLKRCLDSIPERDDVQLIVVDDNSSPEIVDFNNFPGKDRKGIEIVFTKEGKGAGYARNVGLSKAIGKWIIFADADDYFTYCMDACLNAYANDDNDIVFFNAVSCDTDYYTPSRRAQHIQNMHEMEDYQSKDFFGRYLWGEPWGKFIKRSVIVDNNVKCEETPIHNDTQISYLSGYYAKNITFDKRAIYCVTNRQHSVSKTVSDENLLIRLQVFCKKYKFLKEHDVEVLENNFIISPFKHFKETNDSENLEMCYNIAESYGINKQVIDRIIKDDIKKHHKAILIDFIRIIYKKLS